MYPFSRYKSLGKLILYILSFFFLLEGVVYLLVCAYFLKPDLYFLSPDFFTASDKPYTTFSPAYGYKYIPGNVRLSYIENGQVSIDHVMAVNKQGFCSKREYHQKKTQGTYRYLVFGDSYSAGELADSTWVDILQTSISSSDSFSNIELYNFSLDASGILNWQGIFETEAVHFDFDGVILAVFGSYSYHSFDLCRPLAIRHSSHNKNLYASVDFPDVAGTKLPQSALWNSSIYDSTDFFRYKEVAQANYAFRYFRWKPFCFYFTKFCYDYCKQRLLLAEYFEQYRRQIPEDLIFPSKEMQTPSLSDYIPKQSLQSLNKIIEYNRINNKDVIFISVPNLEFFLNSDQVSSKNLYNLMLEDYAKKNSLFFIDGYECFRYILPEYVENYHLEGDMHWNKNGLTLFADCMFRNKKLLDILSKSGNRPNLAGE